MVLLFKYVVGNILYFLSCFTPRSKVIWVFGSWGGEKFSDNPKYLYNYIYDNKLPIKAVWLSRNSAIVKGLKEREREAYLIYSPRGLWFSMRAKCAVISHGLVDVNRFATGGLQIVQTWHGIPMKPILLSDPKRSSMKKRERLLKLSLIFPFLKKELHFRKNLVVCSSSFYVSRIMRKVFGEGAPIKEVGFPRLDGLFFPIADNGVYQEVRNLKNKGFCVGIYMPTYRREGEFDIIKYFLSQVDKIEKKLRGSNQILYLKIHPFDFFKISNSVSSDFIRVIKDEEIQADIYSILGGFDFLLTDFSSVVFDYLILEKPAYLLIPDSDEYIASNGRLVYDYRNIGIPIREDWEEMLKLIGSKDTIPGLKQISLRYHRRRDGENSRRLYNYVINNT